MLARRFAPAAPESTDVTAGRSSAAEFLKIRGLCKRYEGTARGATQALDNVEFAIPRGAFLTLLGPSGCGKSTLLNMIAGLDTPTSGRIEIGGRVVYDGAAKIELAPAERHISMVFQSYAIWPHMSVRENIEFPLKHGSQAASMSAEQRRAAVDHALEKVHLAAFADRPAPHLSGGQQQRVSLARALAQRPAIILLDEPLSNLDANLREHMQKEIRGIVTDEGITAVYVTHDQKEALSMSDVIVLLKDGVVQQVGSPEDIYYRPCNRFVAQFMGSPNIVRATVRAHDAARGEIVVDSPLGVVRLASAAGELPPPGTGVAMVLKQEDLQLLAPGETPAHGNAFELPLVREVFHGDRLEVLCRSGDVGISIYTNARHRQPGDTVRFACAPAHLHYIVEPKVA
jgi:iron(III) transport system ATP-binding protein